MIKQTLDYKQIVRNKTIAMLKEFLKDDPKTLREIHSYFNKYKIQCTVVTGAFIDCADFYEDDNGLIYYKGGNYE